MTGFTTNALLYPLTKGDLLGHPFHGNQYEEVSSGAATEKTPPRPTVGQFQLSGEEITKFASFFHDKELQGGLESKFDYASVQLSKMLGQDNPATKVDKFDGEPTLFRGCDTAGADSLTQPLTNYGKGGGQGEGAGVYFAKDKDITREYVANNERNGKNGCLVEAQVDPNARLMTYDEYKQSPVTIPNLEGTKLFSPDQQKAYDALSNEDKWYFTGFIATPANVAILSGYQGYTNNRVTVITDRSVLKVKY